MKFTFPACALLLVLPFAAMAQTGTVSAPLADVDQQLKALAGNIDRAAAVLPAQKIEGMRAQEETLVERETKVKDGGRITPSEHDALLAAIQTQQKELQAALPKPRTVDPASIPGGTIVNGGLGYVPGTYGSTTTIGPNGSAVMSSGPVVNGQPLGDTIVQPAFSQPENR